MIGACATRGWLTLSFLAAAALLGGCITPPVVAKAHRQSWTLEASSYPQDARPIAIWRDPENTGGERSEPTLRGYFFPSDEGSPVVVHFSESGGSLTSSLHRRDQYHALAELGFASLVVDYRGVGQSDGKPSPLKLGEDAMDIWTAALWIVDGDQDRLIARGASLGTVAVSSLLLEGVRPAACIAFAPVRPLTVARTYGYAVYWDPLVWLVAPFTRTFSPADPLEWFSKPGVPRLVVISPEDELLGERDFERMKRGVESSGGIVEVPVGLELAMPERERVIKSLSQHVALADRSCSVDEVEAEFLAELFPLVPNVNARMDRVERLGSPAGWALVAADKARAKRLEALLRKHRSLPSDLVLAAAYSLQGNEVDAFDGWFLKPMGRGVHEAFAARSFEELLPLLDLDDPGGRLPTDLIVGARGALGSDLDADGAPRWSHARIGALCAAILSSDAPNQLFPLALREAYAADAKGRSAEEAGRRLERCLTIAAGLQASPSDARIR